MRADLRVVLEHIVDAYTAPSARDRRHRLTHLREDGMLERIDHHAWRADAPPVSRADLNELNERGLISVEQKSRRSWLISPTLEGEAHIGDVRREQALGQHGGGIDLSWGAVRPVLHAVVDAWESAGVPKGGVGPEAIAEAVGKQVDEPALLRAFEVLEAGAWLTLVWPLNGRTPTAVAPLPKALAATRGWPGSEPEVTTERVLAALDELAQNDNDEGKRSAAERARDFILDLGSKTLGEVLAKHAGVG
jgi:hypothetical protein